jgi:hypothetical protein
MHLTEDDLVLHYYGELEADAGLRAARHLDECAACHGSFTTLQRVLATVEAAPAVNVPDGFERTVWARLQPQLERRRGNNWFSWIVLSPARLAWVAAVAVLVAVSFFAGRLTEHSSSVTAGASASGLRERVLLTALGDHLDRSQMMLVDLVSAEAASDVDLSAQRTRAEELASDNRLYRQTAMATGNMALAAVLDDLEQVLVDVAASPDAMTAADLNDVRERIAKKGLLLKVRVLSSEVQKRQKAQMRARAGQSS